MADDVDAELLNRFVRGDEAAFEALFGRFQRDVFGWALRIVRERTAAEDVTTEAFWRAFRSRARFDVRRSFGAWMRRIATNAAVDHLQRRGVPTDPNVVLDSVAAPRAPDPDVDPLIRAAFQALPPHLHVVATLALIEQLPYAEIADATGVPIGTVKSRVFRATRALRDSLRRRGLEP